MRRIIFALIALTVIAAATAKAEIFRYGSLVFVGDEENTYAYDTGDEGVQTKKAFYSPPSGNFCTYLDNVYFDADEQLVEYSPDTGNYNRLGSIGGGFYVKANFAGILGDKLYFTVSEGYSNTERNLKCLDFSTGKIEKLLSGVYDACIWQEKLFAVMSIPDENNPDEKHHYFGMLSDDYSSITTISKNAVCPEENQGRIVWPSTNALYFQDYSIDEATGECKGVKLRKVCRDPADGSLLNQSYGWVDDPQAHIEYLGTNSEYLLFRARNPVDESQTIVGLQSLSDDQVKGIVFTGKSDNQNDAELYISNTGIYYIADDYSLWQLEMSEGADHLVARFPQDTIFQGLTEEDVYYVCAGTLYRTSLADLTAVPAQHEEVNVDRDALIGEIEVGIKKSTEACTPSPFIWPEILKYNPQIYDWLQEAAGKNLKATLTLNSGIDISVWEENGEIIIQVHTDSDEGQRQTTLPPGLLTGGLFKQKQWPLADVLEGSRITFEDGICDLGLVWSEEEDALVSAEIPCRIYHTVVSWQRAGEIIEDVMSSLSTLYEKFSIDFSQLSNPSEQIKLLEEFAGDGISLDFYIADMGCILIDASVLKSPKVTGTYGGTPSEIIQISDRDYPSGIRCSSRLQIDMDMIKPIPGSEYKKQIIITAKVETSNSSIQNLNLFTVSFHQRDVAGYYDESLSFPLSGGLGHDNGFLSLSYNPEKNIANLNLGMGSIADQIHVTVSAPEISDDGLLIPFTVKPSGHMKRITPDTEGTLMLECLEP